MLLALFTWVKVPESYADAPKKILVIHSDEEFIPANNEINLYMIEAIKQQYKDPVTFYSEYLDSQRFNTPDELSAYKSELIKRYSRIKPDLIIAVDYKAYAFAKDELTNHQNQLPIVFCMLPKSLFDTQAQPQNVTGNFMNVDIIGTLDLVQRLHPQVKSVSIIAGDGPSDDSKVKEVEERLRTHPAYPFSVRLISHRTIKEYETFVSERSQDEVVVYLSIFEDSQGVRFIPREALARLDAVTAVPIYGLFYTNMDFGLVGGSLFEFKQVALDAAARAVAILNHQSPQSLPMSYVTNKTYVNYPMLERWKIPQSLLPAEVELYKQTFTPWQLYQREIVIILVVMLLFVMLIFVLVIQLRLKKTAEEALKALNTELEHLVDERTADLKLTNSELQQAHQKLLQSEKQHLIQNLSRNLLHKINTPLGVSISYIDLLSTLANADAALTDFEDLKGEEGILSRLMKNQLKIKSIMESLERTLHIEQQAEKTPIHLEEFLRMGILEKQSFEFMQSDVLELEYPEATLWINEKSFMAAIQCLTDYAYTTYQSYGWKSPSKLTFSIWEDSLILVFRSESFVNLDDLRRIFEPYSLLPFKNDDSGLELTIFSNIITLGLGGTVELIELTNGEDHKALAIQAVIPIAH